MNEKQNRTLAEWLAAIFIFAPIVLLVVNWITVWENYVLLQYPIGYWGLYVFNLIMFPINLIFQSVMKYVWTAVLVATIICQFLSWIGYLNLPLLSPVAN